MAIIERCRGVDFVVGYCSMAMIDRWGVCCGKPFRRISNSTQTRSWAESWCKELFLYRPARLEIIDEEDWMTWSN